MEQPIDVQPIILAAGKGTRMNTSLPKVLVGLNGRPLIQHLIDAVNKLFLKHKPVIVVGHKYELVQSYLGPDFIYAFQEGQLGTAHAVSSARSKTDGKDILVLYGDMPFIKPETLNNLFVSHNNKSSLFSMLTTFVPSFENEYECFSGFGRIVKDKSGRLLQIKEFVDASDEERDIKEVNPGIYLFDSKWLWEHIDLVPKNKHGEYYLTDLLAIAINKHVPINTQSVGPMEVFGINTPAQLKQADKLVGQSRGGENGGSTGR